MWKAEVAKKHKRLIDSAVFEPLRSAKRGQAYRYIMGYEKEK
jgi:hypothetical protein